MNLPTTPRAFVPPKYLVNSIICSFGGFLMG
jgi:hypothetical protein